MRRLTLAAAAGLLAFPAFAGDGVPPDEMAGYPPTVQGYIGLYGGAVITSSVFAPALAFDAAAAVPLGALNLQVEARGLAIFATTTNVLGGALVHAYYRNDRIAFGPFGGYEVAASGTSLTNIAHIGFEMLFFLTRATFYHQIAFLYLADGVGSSTGWYARGAIRLFPADNIRLEGGVRFMSLDTQGVLTGIAEAEYQIPARPLSLLTIARVLHVIGGGAGSTAFTALAGFRINLGGGQLIDQGAPMNTLPILY
jgi:hypothetical protein